MKNLLWALVLLASTAAAQASPAPSTLARVRASGIVHCGVIEDDAEYSNEDDHASRAEFDDNLCKGMAVAALGLNAKVEILRFLDEDSAVAALKSGSVDLIATLSSNSAHTSDTSLLLSLPVFYDGTSLLTARSLHINSVRALSGRKICFLAETETELALQQWFAAHHLDLLPFPFQEEGEMEAAYVTGNCAAIASDRTRLSLLRASLGKLASQHILLPTLLSLHPLAMATRSDDPTWSSLTNALISVLLDAEDLGISSHDLASAEAASKLAVQTFLQSARAFGGTLGLRPTWAADVLQSIGNYGQVYDTTFGPGSPRALDRSVNRVRDRGGLLAPASVP
ncbi:MAG TPA: transporter substrate-binding domain-containing protein [Acidobacteriaceae bacterium]|nr:transporter substrate-binding domain-containing protein [Acidobacteriaceae bacterium]